MSPGLIYSVLVPIDFSRQSVWALYAAAMLVRKNQGIIHLLHIVDSRINPGKDDIDKARANLLDFTLNYQQELGVSIIPNVETGNIFKTIGEMANRLGAKIIVMGTHGIKGIQKVIGSYAIRVILGSKVPVILIKDQFSSEGFRRIIIPFEANTSLDMVIEKVIDSGRPFQSTVYLFTLMKTMSSFDKRKTLARIKRTQKQFISAGLESKSIIIQNDIQDFTDAVTRYAQNINADFIALPLQTSLYLKEPEISKTVFNLLEKAPFPLWVLNTDKHN